MPLNHLAVSLDPFDILGLCSNAVWVVMTAIADHNSVLQERILSILNSSSSGGQNNAESGHVKVMKKYSVKNTRYHKTSPVLDT